MITRWTTSAGARVDVIVLVGDGFGRLVPADEGRLAMARYRVTRDVPADEPHNELGRAVKAGELFYPFHGATWGAVDDENGGIALCETPAGAFFEFPESAVTRES